MKKLIAIFLVLAGLSISSFAEIKAVVFDYGGVLTEVVDRTKLKAFIQKSFLLSDDEFLATWKRFKQSKMTEDAFYLQLAEERKIVLPENWFFELEETMVKSIKLNPKMIDLAKEIKDRGYRIAIFSNVRKPLDEYLRNLGHYDGFDPVVLSSEIGAEKPESESYKILMKKLDLREKEFIFIDDRIENVEGAKSLGIDAIHFHSYDELKSELVTRKIL